MSQIQPTSPDSRVIRTYKITDNESEEELDLENESDDDEDRTSIEMRLQQNTEYFENQRLLRTGTKSDWIVKAQKNKTSKGETVELISRPTASNLSHRLLNPYIYRNIKEIESLNHLATLLETPNEWESIFNTLMSKRIIAEEFQIFNELPDDASEARIQNCFIGLVDYISALLDMNVILDSSTKIIVGGILAKHPYDLRSQTDPHFLYRNRVNVIATEVKTHKSFPLGEMWYHGSRGIQTLSALYSFNCPTFLFTQKHWKLFIENTDRNAIFTFPYGTDNQLSPHVNSSLMKRTGTTFVKAIVICLLSRRGLLNELRTVEPAREIVQQPATPGDSIIKRKFHDTTQKPPRRSSRLNPPQNDSSDNDSPQIKVPSFISGYEEGRPIYSTVRIIPQDIVNEIEKEIEEELALQKKIEYQKQSSDLTLCE